MICVGIISARDLSFGSNFFVSLFEPGNVAGMYPKYRSLRFGSSDSVCIFDGNLGLAERESEPLVLTEGSKYSPNAAQTDQCQPGMVLRDHVLASLVNLRQNIFSANESVVSAERHHEKRLDADIVGTRDRRNER